MINLESGVELLYVVIELMRRVYWGRGNFFFLAIPPIPVVQGICQFVYILRVQVHGRPRTITRITTKVMYETRSNNERM